MVSGARQNVGERFVSNILGFQRSIMTVQLLVREGEIVAAAQEERFTRKKHDPGFPSHAVEYCLQGRDSDSLDVQISCVL